MLSFRVVGGRFHSPFTILELTGVSMGCHQKMASPDIWEDGVVVKYGDVAPADEHVEAVNQVILDAIIAEGKVQIAEGASQEDLAAAKRTAADAQPAVKEGQLALATQDEIASAQEDTEAVESNLDGAKAETNSVTGELDLASGEIVGDSDQE
jgi:hypothetical protein